jgi:hypothetical protein
LTRLVYYRTERDKLKDTKYDQVIPILDAVGLLYFISKHFKVPEPNKSIRGNRCCKYRPPNTIIFINKPFIISGDVSHEFAHYLQHYMTGSTRHDKRMLTYTKKIQAYVDTLI